MRRILFCLLVIGAQLPATGPARAMAPPCGAREEGRIAPGRAVVELSGAFMKQRLGGVAVRPVRRLSPGASSIWLLATGARDAAGTCADLLRIAADPAVRRVAPDRYRLPAALPDDPLYASHMQGALDRIGMPAAWTWLDNQPPNKRAVVAVVDTGIVHGHPDLSDPERMLPGYDFISDPALAGDGDGRDQDPADPGTTEPGSSGLHGLHVSGLIAATTGNGLGLAAVAGACQLLPVRVLGVQQGRGVDSDIADGIRWAAGLEVPGVPRLATPADVINLSFSAPGNASFVLQQAISDAIAAGAVVIAAAGDHDPAQDAAPDHVYDALDYSPAGLDGVITVGAAADIPGAQGSDGARAAFSNYGPRVDLLAPGQYLYSTYRDVGAPESASAGAGAGAGPFTYHALSGTSQAAALVSGAAALVRSQVPLRQGPLALLLHVSADPAWKCDQARHPGCGAGQLNVGALLDLAGKQAACACPKDQACLSSLCVVTGALHPSRYGGADVGGGCSTGARGAVTTVTPAAAGAALLGCALLMWLRRRVRVGLLIACLLWAAEGSAWAKVAGLDSSYCVPSDAQLAQAKAAGVRVWMGYLPLPGAAHGWSQSDFQRVKNAGLGTVAYAFGAADATQAKQMAAAWGVPLGLDVEAPYGDGPWVAGWLATSGAGIYGNKPVLLNHRGQMPFAIMAAYPGYDPGTNDPGLGLGVPTGWQWEGTHNEFGCSVDRGWYDDWFAQALPPPDQPPRGALDGVDCQHAAGWAQDPDTPQQPISVHFYFNAGAGQGGAIGAFPFAANLYRADLCGAIGSCAHGFSVGMPHALLDSQPHAVHVYGIDTDPQGNNAELSNSPRNLQCPPPALPQGVRRWVTTGQSLQAWQFDGFWDLIHYPAGAVEALPQGPELPAQPQVVQADDGTPEIWVLDGLVRRHVPDPAAMSAWRFGTVVRMAAAQVYGHQRGPDWREGPVVVQGEGSAVYVVDDDPGALWPDPGGGSAEMDGTRSDIGGGCRMAPSGGGAQGGAVWLLAVLVLGLLRRRISPTPAWPSRPRPGTPRLCRSLRQ